MLWGKENDILGTHEKYISLNKLGRVYDYIITLENPFIQGISL
jgi:hypothetical protein